MWRPESSWTKKEKNRNFSLNTSAYFNPARELNGYYIIKALKPMKKM